MRRRDALGMIMINRDGVAVAEAGGNVYFTQLFARLLDEGRRVMRSSLLLVRRRPAAPVCR